MTFPNFLDQPADYVARHLLGCYMIRRFDKGDAVVMIVETESYDEYDAASHSAAGQTSRNSVMFGPSGHLYVYFTYGMHYCCNVVCGPTGTGSAVLIRAVELVSGRNILAKNRPAAGVQLTNGPAKLCQALAINRDFNGHDLRHTPLQLYTGSIADNRVRRTTRIGLRRASDAPKRWYVIDNDYVSRL